MNFRRIDKNTVQCILSEAEMHAYGFQVEDFFSDQEKSRSFLEHIVEQAEEEVGYESSGGMISMQIARMPNNDLAITFSERSKEDGLQSMIQQIQQLAGMIDDKTPDEITEQLPDEVTVPKQNEEGSDEENRQRKEQRILRKQEAEKKRLNAPKLYRFDTLQDLEQFAMSVTLDKPISSSIYKDLSDQSFYLLLKKGRLKLGEYQFLCEKVEEYGLFCSEQPYIEEYCKEHFQKFIAKQAIRVLQSIV